MISPAKVMATSPRTMAEAFGPLGREGVPAVAGLVLVLTLS
jgi:hypothetical protein